MAPNPSPWPLLLLPLALVAVPTGRSDEPAGPEHGPATDPPAALSVSFHRPDRQLEAMLHWFAGAQHRSPAAVVAALRSRTGQPYILGKPAQAALATLNPEMVRELRTLDGARAELGSTEAGALCWWLRVPRDDGTLAAFASALALGEGTRLPPTDPLAAAGPVDRLGPPGAPVLFHQGQLVVLASQPSALRAALAADPDQTPEAGDGLEFILTAAGLHSASTPRLDPLRAALQSLRIGTITGRSTLDETGWTLDCRSTLDSDPGTPGPPGEEATATLGWVQTELSGPEPADVALVAAVSFDRSGRTMAALYALTEQGLRAAGRLSGPASLRSRVSLASSALAFFPEVELWPRLDGLAIRLQARAGRATSALLLLHAREASAATTLAGRLRGLLRAMAPGPAPRTPVNEDPGEIVPMFQGRPVRITAHAETVRISWGDPPRGDADQALGEAVDPRASRWFQIWPGRLVPTDSLDPEVARAMAEAPPLLWIGHREGNVLVDTLNWRPLGPTVRWLVDTLPPLQVTRP